MTRAQRDREAEANERADTRHRQRRAARLVPCPEPPHGCSVPPRTDCLNLRTGQPLEHQVAHDQRIRNGERYAEQHDIDLASIEQEGQP